MPPFIEKIIYFIFQYLPSFVAGLSLLPCGLIFGYTLSEFVIDRDKENGFIEYGPMLFGVCWGFLLALAMYFVKVFKGHIIFWHFDILIFAGVFNVISSGFYFANSFDNVGSFLSFLAHSTTFITALSYLHVITTKTNRSIFLSLAFAWYVLGIASAVSLIGIVYEKNENERPEDITNGIYVDFAAVYLSVSIVLIACLIGIRVLNFFGNVDFETCMDNELRIANSNGSIFDKRHEIIKRIQFFYVTKNHQWRVSFILLFTDAIEYSMFIYFCFWFSLNHAVCLIYDDAIISMFWIVFLGSALTIISLIFFSVKINYFTIKLIQIMLAILGMIVFGSSGSKIPFWLILLFFGMTFSNIKIGIIETSHFKFTEILLFISYFTKLFSTSIIYFYFVAGSKNSYFYSTDESTLMSQGFVFIIITALLAIVVNSQMPRTHRTSLFDIQYGLLGVIFKKHQIEQLNVKWLNDGTIPTISRSSP